MNSPVRHWLAPVLFLGFIFGINGQSSLDYRLDHSVIDQGGSRIASASYILDASLSGFGQSISAVEPSVEILIGYAAQLNEPPAGGQDTLPRIAGKSAKMLIADLLANDSDLEGNFFSFNGASAASANGIPVTIDGAWIIYESTSNSVDPDSILYFLVDEFGGMASGEILVATQPSSDGTLLTLLRIEVLDGGALKRIGFVGIARRSYGIQATDNLANPDWTTIGTSTAGNNGVYWFEDTEAGTVPARFYRSVAF